MLQNRSGVERLGAPLAETMQRERWSSRRGRFQSSLRFGVDEVEDGRSAQACGTFLLARRGWKDVCRKQSKCCRTSPAATEVAVQCRDSAQQQNRSLERMFQDAMRPIFRLCYRTSAEQAHSQHQPNLDFTTLQRDKATLEIRLEQQQQDLANTLSTLRSCQKLTTCA